MEVQLFIVRYFLKCYLKNFLESTFNRNNIIYSKLQNRRIAYPFFLEVILPCLKQHLVRTVYYTFHITGSGVTSSTQFSSFHFLYWSNLAYSQHHYIVTNASPRENSTIFCIAAKACFRSGTLESIVSIYLSIYQY
jgi:hypothetical protein